MILYFKITEYSLFFSEPLDVWTSLSFTSEGYLGCFHFLVIVNRVAMTMAEQVSSGHMPKNEITASYDRVFLRVLYTDIQRYYTNLPSHQQ